MKHLLKCFILFKVIFLGTGTLYGQSSQINASFSNSTLREFLKTIQIQTDHRLFYDLNQLDTIRITGTFKGQPVNEVLSIAFKETSIVFSIDADKNIFITKEQQVKVNLPKDFLPVPGMVATKTPDTTQEPEETEKPKLSMLDNKLYVIGDKNLPASPKITLAGYVRELKSGEPVIGASVYIENSGTGVSTDQYGYYSLSLPRGRYILNIQGIGLRDARRQIQLYSDGKMNIDMEGQVLSLKNVIISAAKVNNIRGTQMGLQKLDIKTIRNVPSVMGEVDLMRAVLTLPGVKSIGEASTGLNVRGGSADQNLILFNDATIYNPSHFFGMFSAFNPEMIKEIDLYKSSIPVKYGGRLSSVLDIKSREGNKKNFTGSAGIGFLTSRLNIEGPLIKDRTTFIAGARTTYANWLMKYLPDEYKKSRAGFYDANLIVTHEVSKKTTLFLTGYLSSDKFKLNDDTLYGYNNRNVSLKLKHIFSNKLTSILVAGYDRYGYNNSSGQNPVNAYKMSFDLQQGYVRSNNTWYVSNNHTLDFGINLLYYKIHPGTFEKNSNQSIVIPKTVNPEQALETSLYVGDKFTINDNLTIEGGARLVMFNHLGPQQVRKYVDGSPRNTGNIIETINYNKGDITKTYIEPEFRLSARYSFTDEFSMKAGFNSQRQFIHLLSNTAAISPTDIWKLSDTHIRPQKGTQYSFGLYKNFRSNTIETSAEVYYKTIRNFLDYKSGAVLIMNQDIETEVINTDGKAYGVELLVKKQTGKWNGWISYTWSRTLLRMNDPIAGENINEGRYYPASFDKPHDITMINNYRLSHRYSISINGTYSTGRPITVPVGVFYYAGSQRTLYADRNSYRIPDYFRMDVAMNLEGNHRLKQKVHVSWTFGVYNLTGRKNPYSVYYVSQNGVVTGYKLAVFGAAIPYVNFNFKF